MATKKKLLEAAAGGGAEVDEFFDQTILLLHGDGTNGAQNNTFLDSSTNNFTITRNGNTTQGSFSPYTISGSYNPATHGGSGYFDGTGDYLRTPSSSEFAFGTGDFALSAWIYPSNVTGTKIIVDCRDDISGPVIYLSGATLSAARDKSNVILSSGAVIANQWQFVELTRTSGSWRLFINGVVTAGPTENTTDFSLNRTAVVGNNAIATQTFEGYIADARVLKGTGGTTSTVPTAPLTAIANTSFLCNFTNAGIFDSTAKNVLETVGNAQIDTSVVKYGTGSIDFSVEANADTLTVPPSYNAEFDGQFTVEFWLYNTNVNGPWHTLISNNYVTPGAGYWRIYKHNNSNSLSVYWNSTTAKMNLVGSIANNTWHHVALSRGSDNVVRLFIDGTQVSAVSDSATIGSYGKINVGSGGADESSFLPMAGYIDDLRITKGVARYVAAFTPPDRAFLDQ